ncbi:hypothetical protein LTR17_027056 [Elasticomyces elasticus]|nr:hypothetical protein LTR17_027056 [Elasticomyces elasticus]
MTSSINSMADAVQALQELAITAPDHADEVTETAAHKVFRIPELFDLILFGLSSKQLFLVRRVNRMWRDYLLSSTTLKTEMYLLSGPATTGATKVELNPFLWYSYGERIQPLSHIPCLNWTQCESSLSKTLLIRPAMKDARLSILLRFHNWMKPSVQRTLMVQIESNSNLGEVAKAINSADVDKTHEHVLSFSVYLTRVYADGVWRGDDEITRTKARPWSPKERRYRKEWERYEREGGNGEA